MLADIYGLAAGENEADGEPWGDADGEPIFISGETNSPEWDGSSMTREPRNISPLVAMLDATDG